MRRSRMQQIYLKNKTVEKDGEGSPVIIYGDAKRIEGEVWPASGKLQVEQYGNRINYIKNCKVEGKYKIIEQDGKIIYRFNGFSLCEAMESACIPEKKKIRIIRLFL